jgi:hypothetical protein
MKRRRRPKTIAAMLIAGFLAFAPPGTLIACAALAMALFGYCTGSGGKKDAAPETPKAAETRQGQPQQPRPSPTPNATPAPPR